MRPLEALIAQAEAEVARVLQICNACRYCEGHCAVFPAMERRLDFAAGDRSYLANLCHNCGECLYACQYAPPHEFGRGSRRPPARFLPAFPDGRPPGRESGGPRRKGLRFPDPAAAPRRRGRRDLPPGRLLEEERGDEQKAVRATLVEGALTAGHVARTTEFGVFVDLGAGVTGLVHLTEISHARIGRPADVVKPGDFVQVKILRIDDASGKISLSMKQAQDDPWAAVADQFRPGEAVRATVRRHVDFGAFVEVRAGLEALVPSRELPPSAKPWRDDLAVGSEHEFRVQSPSIPRAVARRSALFLLMMSRRYVRGN